MAEWVDEFAGYRVTVSEPRIDRWLDQFEAEHRDLAARILDCVEFIGNDRIRTAFRNAIPELEGWDPHPGGRVGTWRFVPFSVSAGESGDSMLHRFRDANNLGGSAFNENFIHMSDLLSADLQGSDSVVFVDDISASGDQAVKAWSDPLSELLPGRPRTYLVLVVATEIAIDRIMSETGFDRVVADTILTRDDSVFRSRHFTTQERAEIVDYGARAKPREPRGYQDQGHVVVLAHKCPNGTIPILHATRGNQWRGLFPRYD